MNFKVINSNLQKCITEYEKQNGDLYSSVLNENQAFLHTMKMKGLLFESINLDDEFEQVDLLDYLGYERIISCNKNKK